MPSTPSPTTSFAGAHIPAGLSSCSDEELMTQVQASDVRALGELYDRYFDEAYRVSFSMCHERGHAEDAVQDAFISIWRSRETYRRNRGPVASWLMTVVRHRAIDVGRRSDRHTSRCAGDSRLEALPARDDTAAETAAMDDAARLRHLLGELPEGQREVIALAFYGQLTHVQIAARLGLPPGTVKGRMRLGLQRLRHVLATEAPA